MGTGLEVAVTGLDQIDALVARHGLRIRGGFHPKSGEVVFPGGAGVGTIILVGHAGPEFWEFFLKDRPEGIDPLDRWSERVLRGIASQTGGEAVFPSDGPPFWPFQSWAMRADAVFPSPLGLLIHPEFGLWHGYRGALLFSGQLPLPVRADAESPCESCIGKPCLSGCPVSAFTPGGYDVASCRTYLGSDAGEECLAGSCRARRACPVGRDYHYLADQSRLHMSAFLSGLGAAIAK